VKEFVRGDRRVVCSACKLVNWETGEEALLIGPRHFDSVMREQWNRLNSTAKLWVEPEEYGQGFIDQWGVYMDRREAWDVAMKAGQVIFTAGGCEGPRLFSENLY
jgi:hypothetical protein